MRKWQSTSLICAALLTAQSNICTAQNAPAGASISQARVAWTVDPTRHCPDLRIAEDGTVAVVVFLVSAGGVPSRASIKSSSGSEALDAAALSCVMKLKFQPLTRVGDGVPVDSWQAMAWRWVSRGQASAPQSSAISPVAMSGTAAAGRSENSALKEVDLRVCSDAAGQLLQDPTVIHSSGDPALDEAALKIAKAGSGNYRPATASVGKPVSGCAQLAIRFETK
ncbi:MAG: TonB family protein [Steroidobacteraceae bacterium]